MIEEFIPVFQKYYSIIFYNLANGVDFLSFEATTILKSYRLQPEFGNFIIPFDIDMGWFVAVTSEEKETIRTNS